MDGGEPAILAPEEHAHPLICFGACEKSLAFLFMSTLLFVSLADCYIVDPQRGTIPLSLLLPFLSFPHPPLQPSCKFSWK